MFLLLMVGFGFPYLIVTDAKNAELSINPFEKTFYAEEGSSVTVSFCYVNEHPCPRPLLRATYKIECSVDDIWTGEKIIGRWGWFAWDVRNFEDRNDNDAWDTGDRICFKDIVINIPSGTAGTVYSLTCRVHDCAGDTEETYGEFIKVLSDEEYERYSKKKTTTALLSVFGLMLGFVLVARGLKHGKKSW
ncbi:MAG: hypothetical protein DRJ18_00370 [Candidatus Methanomethylicota archaeon]|nr:MAG: hypothetical protein DRJ18_00370 [Candidatus Verstraetearchaeota archaeon]